MAAGDNREGEDRGEDHLAGAVGWARSEAKDWGARRRWRSQSHVRGAAWMLIAVILHAAAVWATVDLFFVSSELSEDARWFGYLLVALLWVVARKSLHRGRRHFVRVGFSQDARDPIVLLRPFAQDGIEASAWSSGFGWSSPRMWLRSKIMYLRGKHQLEDTLVHAFKRIGPVVAIGEPDEKLPEVGARRIYFDATDDHGWRLAASGLIRRSRLVVLQVGTSAGLAWEVEEVIDQLRHDPGRVLLCIPTPRRRVTSLRTREEARRESYRRFAENHRSRFPRGLPPDIGLEQFVAFDTEWKPVRPRCAGKVPIQAPRDGEVPGALCWLNELLQARMDLFHTGGVI